MYQKVLSFKSFFISPVDKTQICRLRPYTNLNENKTSLDIPKKFMAIVSEALTIPFPLL